MSSNVGKGDRSIGPVIGYTDADLGALCQILADFEDAEVRAAREEVARVRVLARAGQLARKQAAGQTAKVRAHDMALRSIALELGAASRVSDRSMQRQINDAVQLVEDYPALLEARETGALGAAIGAGVATGLFPDYEAGLDAMTRARAAYQPDPAMKAHYDRRYRAYVAIRDALGFFWSEQGSNEKAA